MSEPSASASIEISAPPERIYELITDLARVGEWNAECVGGKWLGEVKWAEPGARFVGSNRNGARRWRTHNTVTAAEPGRVFSYHTRAAGVLDVAIWRWELTPSGDGCRVEHMTWDTRGAFMRVVGGLVTNVPDRATHNGVNIRKTLAALKQHAERA
ncbi:SRPBCC family protein [Nonomuraea soli]|uniref:Uncharacterized protein YndB with AHSA1/START domain n=1 Tax=Nonomuraea soli TaxID=1032476 RepID=A0A7W0HVS7_9ACTN|nr:SRPBCC family protein [Nonomuraea soli]MBA2897534.1 uncharacterized protein YndB with AHSA1/START domain [Nonomuraea soli]